jgi:hypothetical protein
MTGEISSKRIVTMVKIAKKIVIDKALVAKIIIIIIITK